MTSPIVALPTPLYNFIVIFVCIAVIFWGIRAGKRISRTFLLRTSAIEQSLVFIRGLANNLSFFDGANQTHMHSLVHTRQSKPPTQMKMLYIPYTIKGVRVEKFATHMNVLCDLWLAKRCSVVILLGFDAARFKIAFDEQDIQDDSKLLPDFLNVSPSYMKLILCGSSLFFVSP